MRRDAVRDTVSGNDFSSERACRSRSTGVGQAAETVALHRDRCRHRGGARLTRVRLDAVLGVASVGIDAAFIFATAAFDALITALEWRLARTRNCARIAPGW